MGFVDTGYFKQTLVEHYHAQRAKRDSRGNLYFVHVMDLEVAGLFNPIFDEGITQGMFGFRLRKISPLDDETVLAHVGCWLISRVRITLSPWSLTFQAK